jgi:hypothetical protein
MRLDELSDRELEDLGPLISVTPPIMFLLIEYLSRELANVLEKEGRLPLALQDKFDLWAECLVEFEDMIRDGDANPEQLALSELNRLDVLAEATDTARVH